MAVVQIQQPKKRGVVRKAFNFAMSQPVRLALRSIFGTAAAVTALVLLGMPLPSLSAVFAVNSIASLVTTFAPTITKGMGLLMSQHAVTVSVASLYGTWAGPRLFGHVWKAFHDGNVLGKNGLIHNTARTALKSTAGITGLIVGALGGAYLASKISTMAAGVHNIGNITKNFYELKSTGIFSAPQVVSNYSFDSVARAGLETLQQGLSIFWQGIGSGLTPEFAAAAVVVTAAGAGAMMLMNPRATVRVARRIRHPFTSSPA